ncbi:YL1-domain-containing protein [Ascobolus immersus RN42]|uniref:YL1-domain-containing protein n=1 Tax=Ascobolus immersus RN42 TaxID=1160509 RepID=A0A3N4IUD9_ASCIM|nr:YL1-domain-containing protein [Ascobolus immersus RN42]
MASPEFPVESLVAGRQRRSTAGNRLASLLHQEVDKDDTLFMEDESDVEFEAEDTGAMSDVQFSSSDDEDEAKPGEGGEQGTAEDPELEGERELQQAEREAKKAARKKAQENFLKPKPAPKRKASVAMPEESTQGDTPTPGPDDAASHDGQHHDTVGFETINGRPRKKSERISWVPEIGPVRQSSRSLAVANKERTIQRLEESEKRRLQIIAQMEAAKQRQGGSKKKKEMTQAERLEEAKITERRNLRSLNRWEEAENQRAEARRERLAALHGQRITGPVVRFWSGKGVWNGEGTLIQMGKISLEEKAKQREEEKKKSRGGRRKSVKEKEDEAKGDATVAGTAEPEEKTEKQPDAGTESKAAADAEPKPVAEGDAEGEISTEKPTPSTPEGTAPEAAPTSTSEVESADKDVTMTDDTLPIETATETLDVASKKVSETIEEADGPVKADSKLDGKAEEPPLTDAKATEKVEEQPTKAPETTEKQQDADVTMEDAPVTNTTPTPSTTLINGPVAPMAPVAPVARVTPPRKLIEVIEDDVEAKCEPLDSDIPSIKAPTVDHSKGNVEASLPVVPSPEPLKQSEVPEIEDGAENTRQSNSTQEPEESKETQEPEDHKGTQEPEGTPKPTPPPQPPQYGVRNVVILEDFDPPITWEAANRFLFPNNVAAVRRDKTQSEICPVTSEVAKYRDPITGVHYASLRAYKQIQKVRAGNVRWCQMFGCYVGPTDDAADGVPEGFL